MSSRGSEPHIVETIARMLHAAVAAIVTYMLAALVGLDEHTARELALLNGGLAYYTDTAVDRIVQALNMLPHVIKIHPRGDLEARRFTHWLKDHASSTHDA